MFNHLHYVPVLKAKAGELRALRDLDANIKGAITPLIEVPPVVWDYVNDRPDKSVEDHLSSVITAIGRAWHGEMPAFLDFYDPESIEGRPDLMVNAFVSAREAGTALIPVTGYERPSSYTDAVIQVIRQDRRGLCLRLEISDLQDSPEDVVGSLLETHGVEASNTDLVLDLGSIGPDHEATFAVAIKEILNRLPYLQEWRTLTLAASAFPVNLSRIPPDTIAQVDRTEWRIWRSLAGSKKIQRVPTFGDYGIQHPELTEVDPRVIRMSANLRYTIEDSWLIFKGRNVRMYRYEQFNDLCASLVARPEFSGSSFSPGDAYIARCAEGIDGPGNATTWRQVGTSHHITFAVRQIANLFSP